MLRYPHCINPTLKHTHARTLTAGHDAKSLALNLFYIVLFLLPIGMYCYPEYIQKQIGVVLVACLVSFVVPPVGWKRPHPYSDMPANRPK
mmetsp:Transcript_4723/g.12020  ORF Transcript_4723/g.12020 Transcript_4723/m.12020 type:complete len:90 (+) Transcript_4723:739-1008(+)